MSMVMLDGMVFEVGILSCNLKGKSGREVIRVQIMGNKFWLNLEKSLIPFNPLLKKFQCFEVFQVTQMLAQKGKIPMA